MNDLSPAAARQAFEIRWTWDPLAFDANGVAQPVVLHGLLVSPHWTLIYKGEELPLSEAIPSLAGGPPASAFELRLPIDGPRALFQLSGINARGAVVNRSFELAYPDFDPRGPARNYWHADASVGGAIGNSYEWTPTQTSTYAMSELPRLAVDLRFRRGHSEEGSALEYSVLGSTGFFAQFQGIVFPIPGQAQLRVGWFHGKAKPEFFGGVGAETLSDSTPLFAVPLQAPIGSPVQVFQARQIVVTWLHAGVRLPEYPWLGLRWRLTPELSKTLYANSSAPSGTGYLNQTSLLGWGLDCDAKANFRDTRYYAYLLPRIAVIGGDGTLFFYNLAIGFGASI